MISCSCSNSVYPIARGEIDSFRGSTCSIKQWIAFHQRTSSPRQTERAWISVTRCTILIQIELAVNSRCLGRTGSCVQLKIELSCLSMCVWSRVREAFSGWFGSCVFAVVMAQDVRLFMSYFSVLSSSPLTKVSTFTWLQIHTHTSR